MKRVNNIYYKICDLDNIIDFSKIISVRTKNKKKVELFDEYFAENIYKIKDVLCSKKYVPGKYNIFLIYEPKLRLIMSQSIRDKIINHLVAKYFLVDVFDKTLLDCNIATRKDKGTHYGIKLIKKYLNEIKKDNRNFYYLKFDISKYFYNIDHDIVKDLIKKKIKDKDVLNILYSIIDSTDSEYVNNQIIKLKGIEVKKINNLNISFKDKCRRIDEINKIPLYNKGKGFPIGNMTSQIFAIMYLNELDYYIKNNLKIKYYIRYMDDGVLIHNDKEYLKYCLREIDNVLDKYQLRLNVNKTKINSIKNGLDFLGFRFYIINNKVVMKLRNDCKKRFRKKIRKINCKYLNGDINYNNYNNSLASYSGHLSWGNCNSLFNKYYLR